MRYLFISCIALDLEKDVNTFGRGTNNDICFEPRAFKKNPQYQAISTKHFKLYRVGMCIALLLIILFITIEIFLILFEIG